MIHKHANLDCRLFQALGCEGEVRLEFKDSQSAGQIRPEDPDAEYRSRYVLMPMRI